ncbi:flagellar basal-body MS-ring/collar protein FliF [Shimia sp. SDUM112013]|uniref:flagellar basal-body MS-ring/collar protein FliF n=1 Tax=Shimia sp. SDUM112013 TaxID=3136160 RepID=UPI0032EF3A9F
MQKFMSLWSSLDLRRRIMLCAGAVVLVGTFVAILSVVSAPKMVLLYGGLEEKSAGEVLSALDQNGVTYSVKGDGIYVPEARRDALRLTLASEGIPANTSMGYELLDSLSGFGTTSQMFDAAYWRAKEGELARTIVSNPQIANARVHISKAGASAFRRNSKPTASVSIVSRIGGIEPNYARALQFLVASAVSGMAPDDVSVIDSREGIISGTGAVEIPNEGFDKSQILRERVQRLLEARVGLGNAVVEVSVETATEEEIVHERIFDPTSRVAISTDTEERSNQSENSGQPTVTVASNLPDGDAAGTENSRDQNTETRERINYEVSETQRETVRKPGTLRRISVAVLVNEALVPDADGKLVSTPRASDELDALQELVKSAIGFSSERGDVVTLKSMSFLPIDDLGSLPERSIWGNGRIDTNTLAQLGVIGIFAVLLGLFVLKPILIQNPQNLLERPTLDPQKQQQANNEIQELSTPIAQGEILPADPHFAETPVPATQNPTVAPVERLRALIADRQDETVEILRSWMDQREGSK